MKSGNVNRRESLGCAPLALKLCLSSLKQYLACEREREGELTRHNASEIEVKGREGTESKRDFSYSAF